MINKKINELYKEIDHLKKLKRTKHIIGYSSYGDSLILLTIGDHVGTKYCEDGVVVNIVDDYVVIGLNTGEVTTYNTSRISSGGFLLEEQ